MLIQGPAEGEAVLAAEARLPAGSGDGPHHDHNPGDREYSSPACYLHELEDQDGKPGDSDTKQ